MWDWAPTVKAVVGRVLLSHRAAVQAPLFSMWELFEVVSQVQSLSGQVISH